ncbi:MAG: radical SAM protein [Kiritimatiellae bacterium]|nr:radical SAM protein [Kiritimatiellia bacterium]
MMNPFLLPLDREELLKRLSARGAPHGGMMPGTMKPPAAPPDPQAVWQSLRPTNNQTLVIYVHIPFCISRCSFCGFYRNRTDDAAIEEYVKRLLVEIDRVADEGAFTKKPVEVVYFGGGTPTALTADQLRRTVGRLHERFNIAPDCEFTIEGRLFAFDDDRVRACLESGVNRFSFGVQSFETELRRSLGRRLSREDTLARLARIKEICGDRIALVADLIYGLPGQTQEDWMERNVKTVHLESALDGVDLYSLKVFPGSPIAKRVQEEGNWSEEDRLARHAEASDYLAAQGWKQLSTTHWGRNALERNLYNTYAKIGVDMVPFGCGAGGFIGDWSIMQEGDLAKYIELVDAGLKPIGMVMQSPPARRDSIRFTRMTDLGYFDPTEIPETDFSPIIDNWTQAGVWTPMVGASVPLACGRAGRASLPVYRLTRLGEFYQAKLNSLLTGFHMAAHASALDKIKMATAGIAGKLKGQS